MSDPLKTPEGIFVLIKNKLNMVMKITTQELRIAIDRFVTRKHGRNSSKAHFEKVNNYTDLTKDKMTVKVFFKYLQIMSIKKITFTVTVVTHNGKEFTVSEDVHMIVDSTGTEPAEASAAPVKPSSDLPPKE